MEFVYTVHVDNGLDYEDNAHWIERVFTSRTKAEAFLKEDLWDPEPSSRFWYKDDIVHGWDVTRKAWIEKHRVR